MKIFIDFETTGISAHNCEIITGFFLREDEEFYYMTARPELWSYEAQEIHGITKQEADKFPPIKSALAGVLGWLPKEFEFICYANPNTPESYLHYDYAVLKCAIFRLEVNGEAHWWDAFQRKFKIKVTSVYTMVQEACKDGILDIPMTVKLGNKRASRDLSLKNVAFNLGLVYEAHDAEEDTRVMQRIYYIIKDRYGTGNQHKTTGTSFDFTDMGL